MQPVSTLPDALEHWSAFNAILAPHVDSLCVLLDFDGTLAPIVPNPAAAALPAAALPLLRTLAGRVPLAIVSGRSCAVLARFVPVPEAYLVGSHGAEIRLPHANESVPLATLLPRTEVEDAGEDDVLKQALTQCRTRLMDALQGVDGCLIENAPHSIPVHYRNVPTAAGVAAVAAAVHAEAERCDFAPLLRLTRGKKVWEIRARRSPHKGAGVAAVLAHAAAARTAPTIHYQDNANVESCGSCVLFGVYVGDDVTDEDAFAQLADTNSGVGVRVTASGANVTAAVGNSQQKEDHVVDSADDVDTKATYTIADIDAVQELIRRILALLDTE